MAFKIYPSKRQSKSKQTIGKKFSPAVKVGFFLIAFAVITGLVLGLVFGLDKEARTDVKKFGEKHFKKHHNKERFDGQLGVLQQNGQCVTGFSPGVQATPLSLQQCNPSSTTQNWTYSKSTGQYGIVGQNAEPMCLNVWGGFSSTPSQGQSVGQYACNNDNPSAPIANNTQWTLNKTTKTINPMNVPSYCLTNAGGQLQVDPCVSPVPANQQWEFVAK